MPVGIISFLELSYSPKSRCAWKKRELGTVSIWSASPISTQKVRAFSPTPKIYPQPHTSNAVSLAAQALPHFHLLSKHLNTRLQALSILPQLGRRNAAPVWCLSPLPLPTTLRGRCHYPRFPTSHRAVVHQAGLKGTKPGKSQVSNLGWLALGSKFYPSPQDFPRKLDS